MKQDNTTTENRGIVQHGLANKPKYAAYGKQLAERQRWGNPPMLIFVCVGGDAFRSAQNHNKDRDFSAMVLMPGQDAKALIWPVTGCPVVIEWDGSASVQLIQKLAKCLLKSGALSVTVYPTWVNHAVPDEYFDTAKQCFVQQRESIQIYYPKLKEATSVYA